MAIVIVTDIPSRHPLYADPMGRSQEFPSLAEAANFAERNGATLFYLSGSKWAFQNHAKRGPDEISG